MARESVFALGARLSAVGFSAATSTALAPVHASKREPRDDQKGKGDRDADLVQGLFDLAVRNRFSSFWENVESLLGLPYLSAERAQGSVMRITKRVFMLRSRAFS